MTTIIRNFQDRAIFDPVEKTAVSVRDGVLEYLGAELGLEPGDKVFRVYRSPATIANAARLMEGIPITVDHVSLDMPAPTDGGRVVTAEMIDVSAEMYDARIAIKNRVEMSDTTLAAVEAGKNELSLGYRGELVPHDVYDFEQKSLVPHHLAVVESGRNGPLCRFLDRKPMKTKLHKAFLDAEGAMNLQQIVDVATSLPEAIKSVPVDRLTELMPVLQEIVASAKAAMGEPVTDENPEDPAKVTDENPEDKKPGFSDAQVAAIVQKATDAAIAEHTAVINKARDFVDETYSFEGKDTKQIMRDVLAKEHPSAKFTDSELSVAFKLLKKSADYKTFGDTKTSSLDALADKEL